MISTFLLQGPIRMIMWSEFENCPFIAWPLSPLSQTKMLVTPHFAPTVLQCCHSWASNVQSCVETFQTHFQLWQGAIVLIIPLLFSLSPPISSVYWINGWRPHIPLTILVTITLESPTITTLVVTCSIAITITMALVSLVYWRETPHPLNNYFGISHYQYSCCYMLNSNHHIKKLGRHWHDQTVMTRTNLVDTMWYFLIYNYHQLKLCQVTC